MAKIYGTPVMAGGAGGANKDLPPLLDNFKAFKGGGTRLKDLPNGTKVKFGTYNSQTLVWRIAQNEGVTKAVLDLDYDTGKTVIGDMVISPANSICGNWAITGWLNATEAGGSWWANRVHYEDSEYPETEPTYSSQDGFLHGWSESDRGILQNIEWNLNDLKREGYDEPYQLTCRLMTSAEDEVKAAWNGERFCVGFGISPVILRDYGEGGMGYSGLSGMGTGTMEGAVSEHELSSAIGIWPACAPNPEAVVSDEPDDDGCYTIDYDAFYVTIQADKMVTSRANELAGAVWVYGDHEPTSVNDGTKIQLTREEVVASDSTETVSTFASGSSTESHLISDLPSNSKIKIGKFNDSDLIWILTRNEQDEQRAILSRESVLAIGPTEFDAAEPSNPNSNRRTGGNNNYPLSNIHQWLNSDGPLGGWFKIQHTDDAPPSYATTRNGFLNQWPDYHKAALLENTWTCDQASIDGETPTSYVSKITLMCMNDVGEGRPTTGSKLDFFNNNSDRTLASNAYYWLTNIPSSTSLVIFINAVGNSYTAGANANSTDGKRYAWPMCAPNPNAKVSMIPDDDGCYTLIEDTSQQVTKVVTWDNTQNFFARQFTYNSKKQYQTMREGAIAKIYSGQSITELPSGSKVKLGTWNDTPLQWKVARDTSDQSIRLVLEPTSVSLLGNKMWDNKEPSSSDTNRRKYGNNRYIYSNIHQWLNATKATGWYVAQHSADAAPDYVSSAGFLSGWSENHLNALDRPTLTVSRSSTDGGGTETFVSRVALMSTTELGLESGTGNGRLDIFNTDGDRATGSDYWTRTPYPSNSGNVRRVLTSGTLGLNYYAFAAFGVRPLCSPKSTTYVSLQPDDDGCYTITGVNE